MFVRISLTAVEAQDQKSNPGHHNTTGKQLG